jgi:hypothetical protein
MTYDTSHKLGLKERRLMDAIRDLFVGAVIQRKSGLIKLMRINSN